MTTFSTLIEEVADQSNHSLAAVLMKSKLLASRLRSRNFKKWVDSELNGYDSDDTLPDYRIIYPRLLADFSGPFGSGTKNVPLSMTGFPENIRNYVERHCFFENIGSLESSLDSKSETYHRHFDIEIVELVRRGPCVRVTGQQMNSIQALFTKSSIQGVLHAIRTRLLDFLIELREKYPELENEPDAIKSVSENDVSQIAEQIFYHNCTIVKSGDLTMGDKYETGQAGSVGPNSTAINNTLTQVWNEHSSEINLAVLATELETLVSALTDKSTEPEHQVAIGNIEAARQSAENGDGPKTLSYLKAAGKWAFDRCFRSWCFDSYPCRHRYRWLERLVGRPSASF